LNNIKQYQRVLLKLSAVFFEGQKLINQIQMIAKLNELALKQDLETPGFPVIHQSCCPKHFDVQWNFSLLGL
jgi:hypothetical protein